MAFYERRARAFDSYQTDDLSFYAHIHGHVELVHVTKGEVDVSVGAHQQTLTSGMLAVIFPNTVHSYHTECNSDSHLLIYDTDLARELSRSLTHRQPLCPFVDVDALPADARFALDALEHGRADSDALVRGYLLVLTARVLQLTGSGPRSADADEDLLYRLLVHLDEHFREDLSLDAIAASLGASRYQISRCFTHRIGRNFNSYLNALRASCAADLLQRPDVSAAAAGYDAGFDSISTFYRAFRQRYGVSPRAYRDKLREAGAAN